MPNVSGSYQGIPVLDGEWTQRAGAAPGRGWVRVLRTDVKAPIDNATALIQLKEFWERLGREFVPHRKQFQAETDNEDGESTTNPTIATRTKPPPDPFEGLNGPFGDLVFKTDAGDGLPATELNVSNIFWLEAVVEDVDAGQEGPIQLPGRAVQFAREQVIRIELADERIIWDLGGYLFGWRNRLINEVHKTMAGRIFQWDPTEKNPSRLLDISDNIANAKLGRPILDPKTIYNLIRPWTAFGLIIEAAQQVPGPPEISLVSKDAASKRPWNVDYGAATLAKKALDDVINKYNLVLAPTYKGTFLIFDRGQNAKGVGGQAAGKLKVLESHEEIPEEFNNERNAAGESSENVIAPISLEIVGDKIIEEVACPDWVMVMRDDGTVFNQGGLGKQGQWAEARVLLDAWGIDFEQAARSVMASHDKGESKAFDFIGDDGDPVIRKRKSIMRTHFFKSFMIKPGAFRQFLPILKNRAEGASHALNLDNMAIQRDAQFFCDGWTPKKIREIGGEALFGNQFLETVPPEEYKIVDADKGVVSFTSPRGSVAYRGIDFGFLRDIRDDIGFLFAGVEDWESEVQRLEDEIKRVQDTRVFALSRDGLYFDAHAAARTAINRFLREDTGWVIRDDTPEAEKRGLLRETTIEYLAAKLDRSFNQEIAAEQGANFSERELLNLSECQLVEPRILGVWAWERNYGTQDDWYRFRSGDVPELAPYPIKVRGIRQYFSIDGHTNKQVCDALAQIQLENFLVKERKATKSSVLRFGGFHQVLPSGTVPEVSFRMSVQQPPVAETVIHENRFLHGTEGRPPAVASWSAHLNKIKPNGGQGDFRHHLFGETIDTRFTR